MAGDQPRSLIIQALVSPAVLFRLPKKAYVMLGVYLAACAAVFALAVTLVSLFAADSEKALLEFLFPESWHWVIEWMINRYTGDIRRILLVNAGVGFGLMLVTVTLFPVKERLSLVYESEAGLCQDEVNEHPLWEQAWQETKLFLMFLGLQASLFWIAYYPSRLLHIVAIVISHLLIILIVAIDFLSPLFQRHYGYYSQILRVLARRPATTLVFGTVFASPVIIVAQLWKAFPSWSTTYAMITLASVNLVAVAWAAVSGTWLASHMYGLYKDTKRSKPIGRIVFTGFFVALLAANAAVYGIVANSLYKKTAVFKCHYSVDWSSFEFDAPGLDLLSVMTMIDSKKVKVSVRFDVEIENPTDRDLEIEPGRIVASHQGETLAVSRFQRIEVAAGQRVRQQVDLSLDVSPLELRKGTTLFDGKQWKLTLYLRVTEQYEFPVYLIHPDKPKKKSPEKLKRLGPLLQPD